MGFAILWFELNHVRFITRLQYILMDHIQAPSVRDTCGLSVAYTNSGLHTLPYIQVPVWLRKLSIPRLFGGRISDIKEP